ncbi:hypothetical protein ACFX11_030148 [Malus domestica]
MTVRLLSNLVQSVSGRVVQGSVRDPAGGFELQRAVRPLLRAQDRGWQSAPEVEEGHGGEELLVEHLLTCG